MKSHLFIRKLRLPCPAAVVFAWHEQPDTLKKLIPPGDPVRLIQQTPGRQSAIGDGARVVLSVGHWPANMRWVAVHEGYQAGRQFVDVQVHGPFAFWRHTHTITASNERESILEDHVEYRLPLGMIGDAVAHRMVRSKIERMFSWRHRATYDALVRAELR